MNINIFEIHLKENDRTSELYKVNEVNYLTEREVLNDTESIVEMCNTVFKLDVQAEEHVYLIGFNTWCEVIGITELSHGVVDNSIVGMRELMVRLLHMGAIGFVVVHNHPSGKIEPSDADIEVSRRIKMASELMQIKFFDHIIIGNKKHLSMKKRKYF